MVGTKLWRGMPPLQWRPSSKWRPKRCRLALFFETETLLLLLSLTLAHIHRWQVDTFDIAEFNHMLTSPLWMMEFVKEDLKAARG